MNATAVRVPVFYGHSEAVHIETRRKITADEARSLLQRAPGVTVIDERSAGGYPDRRYRSSEPRHGLCWPYSRRYVA